MSETTQQGHRTFPHLAAEAFVSDTDKAALTNLQKMPLLPMLVRKFNEFAADRIFYVQNSERAARCGPNQFGTLHGILKEACDVLHVAEPELYLMYSESFNAYTAGVNRTFVVLHSALADDFTDEELLFVIGHELGHIKCGHVLYQMLGRLLLPLLEALGQATLGLGQLAGIGLVSGFYEWMRQAEFSCDRAGLLACQNPRVAMSAIMKLGCGSTRFNAEMNVDTFLEQARAHAESGGLEGAAKALLFLMYNWQLSHPQTVFRAKGLDDWITKGHYEKILNGEYARDVTGATQLGEQKTCPNCKMVVGATVKFCPQCGQNLQPEALAAPTTGNRCKNCGAEMPAGIKFCMECGTLA